MRGQYLVNPACPEIDMDLALSGHPAQMPAPDVDRKEMESKGVAAKEKLFIRL